jgi:hypothetical protein
MRCCESWRAILESFDAPAFDGEMLGRPGRTDIQVLRVHMRNLRQEIEQLPEEPAAIVTEQGIGYRLLGKGEATATM